jgi:DNA polymerase III, delta subunit
MAKASAKDSYQQYKTLLSEVQARKFRLCYLLMGEEPYYIDKLSQYMAQHILSPEEQGFNQLVLYGSDVNAAQVVETARRYPMMAARQVVLLREAQLMRDLDKVEVYLRQPLASTILIICHPGKSVDKRTAFYKAALAKGAVLESLSLREEDVAGWIGNYAKEVGADMNPESAVLLADYLGTDLGKIAMEMDKLLMLLPQDQRKITPEIIEKNVGISKEYSPFALNKALSYKDFPKAIRIVRYFGNNAKNYPLVMVLGTLFAHFARVLKYHALQQQQPRPARQDIASALGMHPYFLGEIETAARNFPLRKTMDAIFLIRAYDRRNKGNEKGEADDGALLQELVCRIIQG